MKVILRLGLFAALPAVALAAAAPKKILVVGASAGFRHASIPNAEKMLRDLAAKSNGEFQVVLMSDAPDYPFSRVPTVMPTAPEGFPAAATGASIPQLAAINGAAKAGAVGAISNEVTAARTALTTAALTSRADIKAKSDALAAAELKLALARADALAKVQATPNRLPREQVLAIAGQASAAPAAAGPTAGGFGAGNGGAAMTKVWQDYMSPAALKNYDGIFFVSTTGNLALPDEKAFLDWVAEGHAVMALHASADRGATSDTQMDMLSGGARFAGHPGNGNLARKIYRMDATHPATKDWPDGVAIIDEFYQFYTTGPNAARIPGVDWSKIHSLLEMDFEGTRMAVAWTKMYGKGRVFYTSLGHRDDVILPDTASLDYGNMKENGNEISAAYQRHVLAGIRWALGFTEADTTLGNHK